MYLADIYTININLAGIPAISLPVSKSKSGLPIGLQILGPHFGEEKIFKVAYAIEPVSYTHLQLQNYILKMVI